MIARHKPLLYVACNQKDRQAALLEFLLTLGYTLYWHTPPLYSPGNWFENPVNEFGNAVTAHVLGIHSSVKAEIRGLPKIESASSDWQRP